MLDLSIYNKFNFEIKPVGIKFFLTKPEGVEGRVLMGIPCDLLPMITQNLKDMEWVLPAYKVGRDKWVTMFKDKQGDLYTETREPKEQ